MLDTCERCQGNGEIVTNWDLYLHGRDGRAVDDEAVSECPDCNGTGEICESKGTATAVEPNS